MHSLLKASSVASLGFLFLSAHSRAQYSVEPLQLTQDSLSNNPIEFDWNRDGIPDFLASGDTNQNLISSSATGTYSYQKVGNIAGAGAIGDFNNDGKLDYVTASVGYLYVTPSAKLPSAG